MSKMLMSGIVVGAAPYTPPAVSAEEVGGVHQSTTAWARRPDRRAAPSRTAAHWGNDAAGKVPRVCCCCGVRAPNEALPACDRSLVAYVNHGGLRQQG